MARGFEVLLPKLHAVRFPDRCPVCGKQAPGHTIKPEALLAPLLPVPKQVLSRWSPELAICKEHVSRVRVARMLDAIAFAGFSGAAIALLVYLSDRFEMFQSGWWSWVLVLAAALVVPRGLMMLVGRPLFDPRSDDTYVAFVLRNQAYAKELEQLNQT